METQGWGTDGDGLYSIGDLTRRTGLAVRIIRFYSDCGIVAPAGRSPAGYRLYDAGAVARLDLVRTPRELGVDLPTIRKVLRRELPLPAVAAAHAEALDGIERRDTPEIANLKIAAQRPCTELLKRYRRRRRR